MCDWIGKVVQLVLPLYNRLKKEVLDRSYIQADETTIKIQDGELPEQCHTGYLWGVHGPPNLIWFHCAPVRSGDVPKEILSGFQGVVQTDAYAGYNEVFVPDGVTRIACLAHVRRKFIEVQSTARSACARVLKLIAAIYQKEGSSKSPEERMLVRKNCTRAMAEELLALLGEIAASTLPKSPLSKAIAYALNQRAEFERIFECGEFDLDNNPIERQMKYIAIGRKYYYFAGSHDGARRAAVWPSPKKLDTF